MAPMGVGPRWSSIRATSTARPVARKAVPIDSLPYLFHIFGRGCMKMNGVRWSRLKPNKPRIGRVAQSVAAALICFGALGVATAVRAEAPTGVYTYKSFQLSHVSPRYCPHICAYSASISSSFVMGRKCRFSSTKSMCSKEYYLAQLLLRHRITTLSATTTTDTEECTR